jgi:ornithine decarboxylase
MTGETKYQTWGYVPGVQLGKPGWPVPYDLRVRSPDERARRWLDERRPPTPCLVVDTDVVADRIARFTALFPDALIRYAVKANPEPAVLRTLVAAGVGFDVASPAEIDAALACGADPAQVAYGNPVKKAAAIGYAHRRGVREFTSDAAGDVDAVARAAPRSLVSIRMLVDGPGSVTPFGEKFGCDPVEARDLATRAATLGLRVGLGFHVGSQQLDAQAWEIGVATAGRVAGELAADGVPVERLNIGGGFPCGYVDGCPPLETVAKTVASALARAFPGRPPELMLEPGRAVVAEAGVLRTEVVLVARRPHRAGTRWVYLDVGRYNGLAETENEYVRYRLEPVDGRGGPVEPVVLAGPTCDGDDVLYQRTRYELPADVRAGDRYDLLEAGAYTASYSSVAFNGIPPLRVHCIGGYGDAE